MHSLTHVCVWTEHGWKRITVEEASALHPGGTVSAHSGLFMCELCGQYVTFTCGEHRDRYFRHSSEEKSKDCPDRTFGTYVVTYKPDRPVLPIRIADITRTDFSLELGLPFIPQSIRDQVKMPDIIIQPEGAGDENVWDYPLVQIPLYGMTYVFIGSTPFPSYTLRVDEVLRKYWPHHISGIQSSGTVFDGRTGEKLPKDADVQVGCRYYYLGEYQLFEMTDIESRLLCRRSCGTHTWYVYEICAKELSRAAAKFFLNLRCRLTDRPLSIQPIWPLYVEAPHLIQHNGNTIYVHIAGNSRSFTSNTFPKAPIQSYPCGQNGDILKIDCKDRQQLISAGRSEMLQFTYFWKEPLETVSETPTVMVTDEDGKLIRSGSCLEWQENRMLHVHTPYDGMAEIRNHDILRKRLPVKADTVLDITEIQTGDQILIFQGMDVIWKMKFDGQKSENLLPEQDILKVLNSYQGDMVLIGHEMGKLCHDLSAYPKVQDWLRRQIRNGYISRRALRYIQKVRQNLQDETAEQVL